MLCLTLTGSTLEENRALVERNRKWISLAELRLDYLHPDEQKIASSFPGRSEGREALRDFFEVDAKHIVYATLYSLMKEGKLKPEVLKKAQKDLGINPDKLNPAKA